MAPTTRPEEWILGQMIILGGGSGVVGGLDGALDWAGGHPRLARVVHHLLGQHSVVVALVQLGDIVLNTRRLGVISCRT